MTLEAIRERVNTRRRLPPPHLRRQLRKSAGVSLREVADVVGVTPQAIALWETGSRAPSAPYLAAYIEVLDVLGLRDT